MRRIIISAITLIGLSASPAVAEWDGNDTLLGDSLENGKRFASTLVKSTKFWGKGGALLGGKLGLVFNDKFTLGFEAEGLANTIRMDHGAPFSYYCAGPVIGARFLTENMISLGISLFTGFGYSGYRSPAIEPAQINAQGKYNEGWSRIIEPAVRAIVRLTEGFDFVLSRSQRYVTGANMDEIDNRDLSSGAYTFELWGRLP